MDWNEQTQKNETLADTRPRTGQEGGEGPPLGYGEEGLGHFQPIPVKRKRRGKGCGCVLALGILLAIYLLAPIRTNILLLGIDKAPGDTWIGRSDTNILVTVEPLSGYVGMLSIPRDLWVPIPGYGENRINTAHVFAEGAQEGSGPKKAAETVEANFGVRVDYTIRVRFESIRKAVDALGGIEVELDKAMGGYPAGTWHLDGTQALKLVRNRTNSDDFYRMEQGQAVVKGILRRLLSPGAWPGLPQFVWTVATTVDVNVPVWQWPRLGFALARAAIFGIDSRTIGREMVSYFTTSQGASVLLPNWGAINPVVEEMFR